VCTGVRKEDCIEGSHAPFLGRAFVLRMLCTARRASGAPAGALAAEELPDGTTGSPEPKVAVAAASWKRCDIDLAEEAYDSGGADPPVVLVECPRPGGADGSTLAVREDPDAREVEGRALREPASRASSTRSLSRITPSATVIFDSSVSGDSMSFQMSSVSCSRSMLVTSST
jgi:hypothetical protein